MDKRTPFLLVIAAAIVLVGCEPEKKEPPPKPPAQETVDSAMAQAANARQETAQERRLRDIERLRLESERDAAQGQMALFRWMLIAQAIAMVVAVLWLAREVRLRRIITRVLQATPSKGDTASSDTNSPPGA
jgi:hypothetical protein